MVCRIRLRLGLDFQRRTRETALDLGSKSVQQHHHDHMCWTLSLSLSLAAPCCTPCASSQLMVSQWKPVITVVNQYWDNAAADTHVAHTYLHWTLTYDVDFQFLASYGHDRWTCTKSRSEVSWFMGNNENKWTDSITFPTNIVSKSSIYVICVLLWIKLHWHFSLAIWLLHLLLQNSHNHYLPTVVLIIIGIPSPTHSFTLGLNPSFSANPPYPSLSFFSFRFHYMDFPDYLLYFWAYPSFYFLVFLFLHFLVVGSVR